MSCEKFEEIPHYCMIKVQTFALVKATKACTLYDYRFKKEKRLTFFKAMPVPLATL